jgi:hypothetical protein
MRKVIDDRKTVAYLELRGSAALKGDCFFSKVAHFFA